MGEIVGFVSKPELERLRLIREARTIYNEIFPPNDAVGEQPDDKARTGAEEAFSPEGKRQMTGVVLAPRWPA